MSKAGIKGVFVSQTPVGLSAKGGHGEKSVADRGAAGQKAARAFESENPASEGGVTD